MPLPKNRSNSVRKVFVRTSKGNTVHFSRRKSGGKHSCALSGAPLQAVDSAPGVRKSGRRPNRKFGGNLSSKAASRVLVLASRVKEGAMSLSGVEVKYLPYVKRLVGKK